MANSCLLKLLPLTITAEMLDFNRLEVIRQAYKLTVTHTEVQSNVYQTCGKVLVTVYFGKKSVGDIKQSKYH